MGEGGEQNRLATHSLLEVLSASDCLSLHLGLSASQREETLPSVAPFKILESPYAFSALEILGLGEPLLLMLHIPQMLGQQTKQNKTKENPGYSADGFYLSLSLASSLLLLASSSTVFHHSRS